MALRLGIFGVLAIIIFCALFFRLWALQVISGDQYLSDAQNNQIRSFRLQAQRGPIVDRDGDVLVTNMPGTLVQVWPAALEDVSYRRREAMLVRLSRVLGLRPKVVKAKVAKQLANDPLTPVTVSSDVGDRRAAFLLEHQTEFPGVQITETYLRRYEKGTIAAQILGYESEITAEQLEAHGRHARGRRPHRPDRDRGGLRLVPSRAAGPRARLRRRARARDERAPVQPDAGVRRQPPTHDRRRAPAHGRGGPRLRRPARTRQRRVGRERRRARGHGREDGRDPRAGVQPDVRPERLRRHGRREGPRSPCRQERELSDAQPRDRRHLSARLDVQADHRARRARAGSPEPRGGHPVHREDGRSTNRPS